MHDWPLSPGPWLHVTLGVCLWFLWPYLAQKRSALFPTATDSGGPLGGKKARPRADHDSDGGEIGPYPRLATEIAEIRGLVKQLQNEWTDKEHRLDAIVKRAVRLKRVEELEEPPQPSAPALTPEQQRAALVTKFRQQQGG